MQARRLKIENLNNKFACIGFTQIHLAPPPGTVREADFDQLFVIDHNGADVLVRCVDFTRIPFKRMSSLFTIPATGQLYAEWEKQWLEKHPNTEPDTELAVYCYLKY